MIAGLSLASSLGRAMTRSYELFERLMPEGVSPYIEEEGRLHEIDWT